MVRELPGRAHALKLEKNGGKAEAVRRGMLHAFSLGAALAGYWDADLATPLRHIADFARLLEQPEINVVLGSRVRMLGHEVTRSSARHYIGRGFATLAGLALRLPVYDTQCGAKLFRVMPEIVSVFEAPFELGWCFDVEIIARLLALEEQGLFDVKHQCVEFPLPQWIDAPGSKLGLRHYPRILKELGQLFLLRRG